MRALKLAAASAVAGVGLAAVLASAASGSGSTSSLEWGAASPHAPAAHTAAAPERGEGVVRS
jgi:hypothetical protein